MDDTINSKFQYDVIYINIGFRTVNVQLSVQYAISSSTVFIVTNRLRCINSVFLVLMARQQSTAEAKALSTQY